ncbi:MAG TPA: hypothetical protein VJV23_11010 [Candidatus Polarisedimenticolia bacterium]|nr:hypothetical protein [Candidatus Polarisedimenticolia bacterium]
MRTKLTILAAAAAIALTAAPIQAMTVDEIIAKNVEARGGKDKLAAVKSATAHGRMTVGPGMESAFRMRWKKPSKVRIEFTLQGMTGIQAFDGSTGWQVMPFLGKNDAEKMNEEDLKNIEENADFDGPLVDYKSKGHQVELLGKEAMEGTEAYKLKLTKKDGDVSTIFLDAEAFLEIKIQGKRKIQGMEMEFETVIGDYKDVGGLLLPHSIENKAQGMPGAQVITFEKYEVNVEVPDSDFAMPAPAPAAAAEPAKP